MSENVPSTLGLYEAHLGDSSSSELAVVFIFPRMDVFYLFIFVMVCNLLLIASCIFWTGSKCQRNSCEDDSGNFSSRIRGRRRDMSRTLSDEDYALLDVPLVTETYACYEEPRNRGRKPIIAVQIV
mmetsp:Transcript_19128/g.27206  ORF Transcript_19128/g.27206 Transcript_19128/m.27206 type:complete len:126 (+) Transcript_19128:118-495(+)